MALNLDNLINAYNGAAVLQAGAIEWGFVEPEWYLALPVNHGLPVNHAHVIDTNPFGDNLNVNHFLKANYARLMSPNALNQADKALFITMLRYHAVRHGLLDMRLQERGVIESEYSVQNHQGADWDHALNNIPAHPQAQAISNYVKKYGDTIIQIMTYVFCARGHHWQPEYDALYDRLLAANSIQKPNTWQFPTNRELFRQSLHCFGVRIPLEYTLYCKNNNRMGNPMTIRFTPHAPIAGAAQALTTFAVLQEMRNEPWIGTFVSKFEPQVAEIEAQVAEIRANPYEYHVASRILTGNPKRQFRPTFNAAFNRLIQLCLGYLDYLGRKNALSGQQTLTHHSGGPKALADVFARACDRLGRPSLDGVTMDQFIRSL
jgi:hypothetical protein